MAVQRKVDPPAPAREEMGLDGLPPRLRAELEARLQERRFPHAVLFETGDAACARRTALTAAAGLLCQSDGMRPCGKCPSCHKVETGSHPDLLILEGDGGQRSLHVEEIRSLRRDSVVLPNESEVKVYVLLGAQNMSEQAQNALLKVLEEPPERVRFILTCDDRSHLLGTILSRCTLYSTDNGIQNIAGGQAQETAMAIAAAVGGPSELELMRCTAVFEKDRRLMAETLTWLMLLFRQAIMLHAGRGVSDAPPEVQVLLRKLASDFSIARLSSLIQAVRMIEECMDRNANQYLMITRLSALLRGAAGR